MKISRKNKEHLTCAITGEPLRTELFVEGSILYRILGDLCGLYAATSVFVVGTVQAQAIKGLKDHEALFNGEINTEKDRAATKKEVLRRIYDSYELVGGIVLGVTEQDKADAAFAMRELHRKIQGKMDDGTHYHAWQPEVWSRAWAGIFIGFIYAYEKFRGFKSQEEKDLALLSAVELGKTFGVLGVPDKWDEFNVFFNEFMNNSEVDEVVRKIAVHTSNGFWIGQMKKNIVDKNWKGVFNLIKLFPLIRFFRIGALVTIPEVLFKPLNIQPTIWDRAELNIHIIIWRCIPSSLTLFGPKFFKRNAKNGRLPVWRKRFSRENLEAAKMYKN